MAADLELERCVLHSVLHSHDNPDLFVPLVATDAKKAALEFMFPNMKTSDSKTCKGLSPTMHVIEKCTRTTALSAKDGSASRLFRSCISGRKLRCFTFMAASRVCLRAAVTFVFPSLDACR